MASKIVSDVLSAIDDLFLVIASSGVELEVLLSRLRICEKEAHFVEKLEKDERIAERVADFRRMMCQLILYFEHERWLYLKKMEEYQADGEKQVEEPKTMEMQVNFKASDQPNFICPVGMRESEMKMRNIIYHKFKGWRSQSPGRQDMKTSDPRKTSGRDPLRYIGVDEKVTLGVKNYEDNHPKDFMDMDRMLEAMDLERRLEALTVTEEIKKSAKKGPVYSFKDDKPLEVPTRSSRACNSEGTDQDENESVGAYSVCSVTHWSPIALLDATLPSLTSQIYGRDCDRDYIIQWLLSDTTSNFSPVWDARNSGNFCSMLIVGKAGVGKTTLAKLVYDDSTVKENFSARAWVHAADGSDTAAISTAIFSSITGKSCSERKQPHLQTIIREHVNGKRVLLVLDGFENQHRSLWEHLRDLFSGVKIVKLLITCRRQSDAQEGRHLKSYNLHSLPQDLSWNLFFKCAFSDGPAFRRHYSLHEAARLIEISKPIVSNCKGLPLAVKVLGCLLRYHLMEKTWRRILKSDRWRLANCDIVSVLQLCYSHMPWYLKPCFLYSSVFPKGFKLDKYELIRLWMAQGYIMPRDNRRVEDVGIDYFEELQRMSFFDSSSNGDGTFTLHDLLYDLSKLKSGGECCSVKDGGLCDISVEVRHLYVIDGAKSTLKLTSNEELKPIRLHSFFYTSLDGTVPKYLPLRTNYLRALDLTLYDDSAAAPEITQRPCLDKANVSSINFAEFISLRYLRVCDKSMESLPASVCQLRLLQTLHLDKCSNLRELSSDVGNLVNLRYLGLSDASLQMLPESVCRLFNLQSLILDNCRNLSALPDNIGRLFNLHYIGLSRTNLKRLPDSFRNLSKLPILKLDNCKLLVELPSSIGELVDLESLEVTGTKINSLPESVCHLSNLLKLDVAGSDLLELPDSIGNLFNLNCLVLSRTNISILPESLCRLSSLHTLKLDNCKNLACLSSGIGDLVELCELLLSDTNIVELPESICKLSNLQRLDLDGCTRFLSLPHNIGQLTSLCHINLSDTQIAELPASICQLTNLQTLELNDCYRLSEMPHNIGNLTNLCDLQVTETQVRELPKSLCQLSKLKILNLNGNRKLKELPSGIENLTNLRHLELYQVAISVLPKQICQLSRLEKLNFEYMQKLSPDSYL